ncbi:MAG: pyruvate dehydrogenase (acetyl-transferring) E1 component subunit alpha [Pseudomonadales bacterium]|nr:pyruvate dehydrogenase (acetyl-transferring) E1 component subunit alpha [Pseudomonadales bacterium]
MITGKAVKNFSINFSQRLNEHAELLGHEKALQRAGLDTDKILALYQTMVLTRTFDSKAIALQRTGRLGTYASCLGQEAIGTAIGHMLEASDVFVQAYRETAALLKRGVKMQEILLYWGGDERGSDYQACPQDLPPAVPIASQCLHAVGIAYAMQLEAKRTGQEQRVCLVVCGDGATSKGDFYEALNAAALWQLPLVFVICNNQWAISLPRSLQSHSQTLAQKAIAADIPAIQIDGNDVLGCYETVQLAIKQARGGHGPQLIEAITYRLSDHTTADDAKRYRTEEELQQAWEKEPIKRLSQYLLDSQRASQSVLDNIQNQCTQDVEAAVDIYLATEPQPCSSMFEFLYQDCPVHLQEQLASLKGENHGQ